MVSMLTARCASLASTASTPRRAGRGARVTRSVRRTEPREMRRHPRHVALASGSERDESAPDDEGSDARAPAPERKRINITGMGSRYANVEEISDGALVVAFLLAVASTFAVGWLVATAPNKDSPQFRTTLPVDDVPLGFVDEIDDREPFGRT